MYIDVINKDMDSIDVQSLYCELCTKMLSSQGVCNILKDFESEVNGFIRSVKSYSWNRFWFTDDENIIMMEGLILFIKQDKKFTPCECIVILNELEPWINEYFSC